MPLKANYKSTLLKVLELQSNAALLIYQRIKLLCEVFDDRDFRLDLGNADDFRAAAVLDRYLDDTPWTFLELRAVFVKFPQAADWRERSLREMVAVLVVPPTRHESIKTRQVISQQEHECVVTELKAARAAHQFTKQLLQERVQSYEELLAENKLLRQELEAARTRIRELETTLETQLA